MATVAKKIKDLREGRGLSQNDVAHVMRMSRPTYNAMETGRREPTLTELVTLSGVFGITLEELLFNVQSSVSEPNLTKFKQVILNCLQYGSDEHDQRITKTKLAKLVYLSDFTWFYRHLEPMSGVGYRCIQQGPVADAYFRVIDELFEDGAITIEQRGAAMMIRANEPAPTSELAHEEIALIKEVCAKWQGKSTQEIVEFTHQQLPWKTCHHGELISYEAISQERADNIF